MWHLCTQSILLRQTGTAITMRQLGAPQGNMLAVHYVVHITGRRIDKPGRRQRAEGSSCK
jgi:hypothetical protein